MYYITPMPFKLNQPNLLRINMFYILFEIVKMVEIGLEPSHSPFNGYIETYYKCNNSINESVKQTKFWTQNDIHIKAL